MVSLEGRRRTNKNARDIKKPWAMIVRRVFAPPPLPSSWASASAGRGMLAGAVNRSLDGRTYLALGKRPRARLSSFLM